MSSTLQKISQCRSTRAGILWDVPLLGHHQDALNHKAFEDLRPDALEQAHGPFVLDDEPHNLDEALKGLSLPRRGRLRLQADLGYDEGLGNQGGEGFGHCAKCWRLH